MASHLDDYLGMPVRKTYGPLLDMTDLGISQSDVNAFMVGNLSPLQADSASRPSFAANVAQLGLQMGGKEHQDYSQGEVSFKNTDTFPLNQAEPDLMSGVWFSGLELVPAELLDQMWVRFSVVIETFHLPC